MNELPYLPAEPLTLEDLFTPAPPVAARPAIAAPTGDGSAPDIDAVDDAV